jgi:hypothetical protein
MEKMYELISHYRGRLSWRPLSFVPIGLFSLSRSAKNFLIEFELFNQTLDLLHADLPGNDQGE